ncbi:hypothetical protein OFN28_31400, partial [Escherichia coli]|nr:hypothetical protein [Escherichia coli]
GTVEKLHAQVGVLSGGVMQTRCRERPVEAAVGSGDARVVGGCCRGETWQVTGTQHDSLASVSGTGIDPVCRLSLGPRGREAE